MMKKVQIALLLIILASPLWAVQRGGSGTDNGELVSGSLEVTVGGLKLGNTTQQTPGTIRWNGADFQGWRTSTWESFTATSTPGASGWTDSGATVALTTLTDSVGIGIASPLAKLHVQDGGLLIAGTSGSTPTSGSGTRLMWIPAKAAFRAGSVSGTQWDDANIGNYSVVMGSDSTAKGNHSIALGYSNLSQSTFNNSVAVSIGTGNTSTATAENSVAITIGRNCQAYGDDSLAIGDGAIANGQYSTAIGGSTKASGTASLAVNLSTVASGNYSTAIGYATLASAEACVAMGYRVYNNTAYSLGIGYNASTAAAPDILLNPNGDSYLNPKSSGNLAIGQFLPSGYKLNVNGKTYINGSLEVNSSLAAKTGGGSWNTLSDGRLKDITGNYTRGLKEVLQLKPIKYRYKKDNPLNAESIEEHVGFIAQDVQAVIPEAVTTGKGGYLTLNADPILWAMLNAVKEQQTVLDQQDKEFENLKTEIAELKGKLK